MQRSKTLIAQALATLRANMERTGDPLGFKSVYWTGWAEGLGLPANGDTVLLTARMYQMLPYVVQATEMAASAKPLLPLLSVRAFSRMALMAGAVAGEPLIRLKARKARAIKSRADAALRGITGALALSGVRPAYLYAEEPYSGALLHDLGLEADIAPHVRSVYRLFKSRGIRRVITVDPHTTFMLKHVFPEYIMHYDLDVRHYFDCLTPDAGGLKTTAAKGLPHRFVLHDSCVMTRNLGIVAQARKLARSMGIELMEPESTREDTACCGGPVEYAYADLSGKISNIRARELARVGTDILVTCPICLINLMKYERALGVRVWDMGELLFAAANGRLSP